MCVCVFMLRLFLLFLELVCLFCIWERKREKERAREKKKFLLCYKQWSSKVHVFFYGIPLSSCYSLFLDFLVLFFLSFYFFFRLMYLSLVGTFSHFTLNNCSFMCVDNIHWFISSLNFKNSHQKVPCDRTWKNFLFIYFLHFN